MNRILIVVAHPDDEVLGSGGFLAKYYLSKTFRVVFIAEGVSARFPASKIDSSECLAKIDHRNSCARDAMGIFGVEDIKFNNYPCGRLDTIPIIDINKIIESEIMEFDPDLILTHSETDCNNDHRIVFRAVIMATRPGALSNVGAVASIEVPSSTEWSFSEVFEANYFESISEQHVQLKIQALSKYSDEVREESHPRSGKGVRTLALYRGYQSGVEYAEAYRMIRIIR